MVIRGFNRTVLIALGFMIVTSVGINSRANGARFDAKYHKDRVAQLGKRNGIHSITSPSAEVLKAVELIARAAGLENNFQVFEAQFKNSPFAFTSLNNGFRYIVYDGKEFNTEGYLRWHMYNSLSHEIGHLIQWGVRRSDWEKELFADRFAGFITSRLNGRLDNALSLTEHLSFTGSKSHPPRIMRKKAFEEGWRAGEAEKAREGQKCSTGWSGEALSVDGQACRIARYCDAGKARYKLACQDYDDQWVWMK